MAARIVGNEVKSIIEFFRLSSLTSFRSNNFRDHSSSVQQISMDEFDDLVPCVSFEQHEAAEKAAQAAVTSKNSKRKPSTANPPPTDLLPATSRIKYVLPPDLIPPKLFDFYSLYDSDGEEYKDSHTTEKEEFDQLRGDSGTHATFDPVTIHTTNCDRCNVRVETGDVQYRCTKCSQQMCQDCAEIWYEDGIHEPDLENLVWVRNIKGKKRRKTSKLSDCFVVDDDEEDENDDEESDDDTASLVSQETNNHRRDKRPKRLVKANSEGLSVPDGSVQDESDHDETNDSDVSYFMPSRSASPTSPNETAPETLAGPQSVSIISKSNRLEPTHNESQSTAGLNSIKESKRKNPKLQRITSENFDDDAGSSEDDGVQPDGKIGELNSFSLQNPNSADRPSLPLSHTTTANAPVPSVESLEQRSVALPTGSESQNIQHLQIDNQTQQNDQTIKKRKRDAGFQRLHRQGGNDLALGENLLNETARVPGSAPVVSMTAGLGVRIGREARTSHNLAQRSQPTEQPLSLTTASPAERNSLSAPPQHLASIVTTRPAAIPSQESSFHKYNAKVGLNRHAGAETSEQLKNGFFTRPSKGKSLQGIFAKSLDQWSPEELRARAAELERERMENEKLEQSQRQNEVEDEDQELFVGGGPATKRVRREEGLEPGNEQDNMELDNSSRPPMFTTLGEGSKMEDRVRAMGDYDGSESEADHGELAEDERGGEERRIGELASGSKTQSGHTNMMDTTQARDTSGSPSHLSHPNELELSPSAQPYPFARNSRITHHKLRDAVEREEFIAYHRNPMVQMYLAEGRNEEAMQLWESIWGVMGVVREEEMVEGGSA
ncbi:hypothetical protein GLAREA_00349 [Glarea lozoyensis ATCC 20868]|uniref:Uncharacterized protein n=1 Tax=Glarea lozoyensis (strain ATCC 20868 / MF5171) TaxID=1116229 RepID=S3CW80_GLAL2|nr:uncharacterized protein GLAREA_00349 [Glarea lozoyensis ATCC 20868]EPE29189.1 hypothetical protein GLAREA_00349 [Glarea lozoyensis ATCC 20868]